MSIDHRRREITCANLTEIITDLSTLLSEGHSASYAIQYRDFEWGFVQIAGAVTRQQTPHYLLEAAQHPPSGLAINRSIDGMKFRQLHIPGLVCKLEGSYTDWAFNTHSPGHTPTGLSALSILIGIVKPQAPYPNSSLLTLLTPFMTTSLLNPKPQKPQAKFNLKPTLSKYFGGVVAEHILKPNN